jgi:hypothetical protein
VFRLLGCALTSAAPLDVIRRDGRAEGRDREFRFISFNIPNLHYVEATRF